MSIPSLDKRGLLPLGIHDCALEEAKARFGSFQNSDRRPALWAKVEALVIELRSTGLGLFLLINGSFVTAKINPQDVDLILVVSTVHDFSRELTPAQYNILSAQRVRRRHGLDLLVAREDSDQYRRYLELFQQVRLEPDQNKGILRVKL